MTTTGRPSVTRKPGVAVGLAVLALALGLGIFIQFQARDLGPPEDVPRQLAIPALYVTMGLLAIIGAWRRRPAVVIAAGALCMAGTILSVATLGFAVPGVALILIGSRPRAWHSVPPRDAVIAATAFVLVVGAAVALLAMTEERCWQATGSAANPTYTVFACAGQTSGSGSVGPGQGFASGSDGGALTAAGGLVEGALLLGALALTIVGGRTLPHGNPPAGNGEPPR